MLLTPIWSYGIQVWGTAKPSNIKKIQTFQSTSLCLITGAPYYVSNLTLHTDLHINTVSKTVSFFYKRFRSRLVNNPNPLIRELNSNIIPGDPPRRLARRWCRDLVNSN